MIQIFDPVVTVFTNEQVISEGDSERKNSRYNWLKINVDEDRTSVKIDNSSVS